MKQRLCALIFAATISIVFGKEAIAGSKLTIGFEGLSDGSIIEAQYSGLIFSNSLVLTAGVSLNELEFPPNSGSNVASDNNSGMRIDFSNPMAKVSGYFNYTEPLALIAFDVTGKILGASNSQFQGNGAISGSPGSSPNEYIELAFVDISYVTFTGSSLGGSFTVDDLSFDSSSPVPEPATIILWLIPIGLLLLRRNRRHLISRGC